MKTTLSATHVIAASVIATAFAAGFLSGPALAEQPALDERFELRFQFDPSELTNAADAKRMLERMERKVSAECSKGRYLPSENRLVRMCVERTMTDAVDNFGNATLAQAYKSRTGG